jgi:hypothetical protein
MSSNDFVLFTANTHRKPSPVLIYWSLIALKIENHNVINCQTTYANQYLSPLMLWVRTPLKRGVSDATLCDKVCQWLEAGRWFSLGTLVSSNHKIARHDITEILLKVALNTIALTHNCEASLPINTYWSWNSIEWFSSYKATPTNGELMSNCCYNPLPPMVS